MSTATQNQPTTKRLTIAEAKWVIRQGKALLKRYDFERTFTNDPEKLKTLDANIKKLTNDLAKAQKYIDTTRYIIETRKTIREIKAESRKVKAETNELKARLSAI